VASIFLLCLIGCSGSEEAKKEIPPPPPSATETMQKEMNDLKSKNESLKKQVAKLEQDNRTAIAKAAELETQLTELKEKAAAPPPIIQKPIPTNARGSYKEALNLFRSRNYAEAASLFQSALDAGIQEKMQDNCYYWLGECAYGEKKYDEAIEHFQKVFTFKISEKKDDSQLMIGNSYLALGNKEKAKEAFERFTKKFPASPFIKRVKEKLGKL
jgi:TolA-binding protein